MPAEARQPWRRHPLRLWAGWVIGPVAWSLHLMVSYLMVKWVCETGYYWALHLVTLATLLMALGGAWVAWRQWQSAGVQWPGGGGGPRSRVRFMAAGGLVVSALSALVILVEGIPNLILSACI